MFQNSKFLESFDIVNKLYSVNAKKIDLTNSLRTIKANIKPADQFSISIKDLINGVNTKFNDIFSIDVYKKLGTTRAVTKDTPYLRYSERDPKAAAVNRAITRENEKLKKDNERLKELVKIQGKVTGSRMLNKQTVEKSAAKIMRDANATGDKAEFTALVSDVYNYIFNADNVDFDEIQETAKPAIDWLLKHQKKGELSQDAKDVFSYLKGTKIYISPTVRSEIENRFGYNDFRKKLMGRVSFTDNSSNIALDELWQELAEKFPNYFDSSLSDLDQPEALYDLIEDFRNGTDNSSETRYYEDFMRQEFLTDIYDGYWDTSTLHTVADKYQKQINKLKAEHKTQIKDLREQHREKVADITKQLKQEKREALKEYRQSAAETQREMMRKFRERTNSRKTTEIRNKVKRYIEDFRQRLMNPTERRYIPSRLVTGIIDVYDAIDPTGVDQTSKAAQKYRSAKEALADLRIKYESLQDEDYEFSSEFNAEFAKQISDLAEAVGDKPLRDMDRDQITDVYTIIHDISAMIHDATKQIGTSEAITNYEAGQQIISDMERVKNLKVAKGNVQSFMREWTLNPMRAVREMSGENTSASPLTLVGTVVTDTGIAIDPNVNNIEIDYTGTYQMNFAVTVNATTGGDITIQLYNNGVAIPEAVALVTVPEGYTVINVGSVHYFRSCMDTVPQIQVYAKTDGTAVVTVSLITGNVVKLA